MTAKKVKDVNEKIQITLDNVKAGMIIKNHHGEDIKLDNDLISQMKAYEMESKKKAIFQGKVTGGFLYFKYFEDNPEEKTKEKKKSGRPKKVEENTKLDEAIESEVEDEEHLLLDCIEDYKAEYNVKKVNTNTKKFQAFFEEWKKVD